MRDPKRIDSLLHLLGQYWRQPQQQDKRLGQLIDNIAKMAECRIRLIEDEYLIARLKVLLGEQTPSIATSELIAEITRLKDALLAKRGDDDLIVALNKEVRMLRSEVESQREVILDRGRKIERLEKESDTRQKIAESVIREPVDLDENADLSATIDRLASERQANELKKLDLYKAFYEKRHRTSEVEINPNPDRRTRYTVTEWTQDMEDEWHWLNGIRRVLKVATHDPDMILVGRAVLDDAYVCLGRILKQRQAELKAAIDRGLFMPWHMEAVVEKSTKETEEISRSLLAIRDAQEGEDHR